MIIKNHFKGCYNGFNQEIFDYLRDCESVYDMRVKLYEFFRRKIEKKKLIMISSINAKINLKGLVYELETRNHFTAMLFQGYYIRELHENDEGNIIVKDGNSLYYWNKREKQLYPTTGKIGNQLILEMTDKNRLWVFNRVSDEYIEKVLKLL